MAKDTLGLKTYILGHYVCPETDQMVPVPSAVPLAEADCPFIIEVCPACGEKHEVCCGDLLEADDSDLE
jgi:hypothetical protein